MPQRFLILGPSWLGDAVMAIPTYRNLRRAFPDAHIAVMVRGAVADLYRAVPAIDEVVVYGRAAGLRRLGPFVSLVSRLIRTRPDTVIILPRSFGSAWTAFLAGANRRIGYAANGRSYLLTDPLERGPELLERHRVLYLLNLLTPLAIEIHPEAPVLAVPVDAERSAARLLAPLLEKGPARLVAFNPGANYGGAKQWPEERYVALARELLREHDLGLVLVGGPGDHDVCDRIRHAVDHERILDTSGRTSVLELAAILRRSAFAVSNDTGAMHVAAAVGTPIIAIFGPTDPKTTPPYGENHVLLREPVDCSPCLLRECPIDHRCMLGVDVGRVARACDSLLAEQNSYNPV